MKIIFTLLFLMFTFSVSYAKEFSGEVDFISLGTKTLEVNGVSCISDRYRTVNLKIIKNNNGSTAYITYDQTDTPRIDDGSCGKVISVKNTFSMPITIDSNRFFGTNFDENKILPEGKTGKSTTLQGVVTNGNVLQGSYTFFDDSKLANNGNYFVMSDGGDFSLTLTSILNAEVQAVTGTSLSITPIAAGVLVVSGTIPEIGVLLTLEDSSATIVQSDGSTLDINQKSVVTLKPESISVIRGEVTTTVDCNYEVRTALATITSCPTTKKGADTAKFTTNYSQSGLGDTSTVDDILTVTVETGTVDIVDRSGVTHTVSAGDEKTITSRVPRTQWVLPIDGDKIYGGESNLLIWTEFPKAASYQMEFNLPSPVFAEENVASAEFPKQVIPLPAGSFTKYDGLIIFPLPFPEGADGLMLELRIFALDATGKIISESVSSDSTKATVTD